MKRTAVIAAAGFVLLARVGAQQPPQTTTPVLRASVDQVVVDVVVTDEHGGVVPGLTAGGLRDRRARPAADRSGRSPRCRCRWCARCRRRRRPWPRTSAPTSAGRRGASTCSCSTTTTSASGGPARCRTPPARSSTARCRPAISVAVVTTTGVGGAFQDFTEDGALASAAVERFVGRQPGETAALQATAEDASMARAAARRRPPPRSSRPRPRPAPTCR